MKTLVSLFAIVFMFSVAQTYSPAFAQTEIKTTPSASPGPVASPVPSGLPEVAPTPAAAVSETAAPPAEENFLDKLWKMLSSAGGMVTVGVVLFEIFVRAFPTKNPLSVLVPVKGVLDNLVKILNWVSNSLLVPLINVANKSKEKL
ncbi:hypothetical protein UFOVP903_43 [uncultured Caudovirales phage]|uniref:Uncharacterized protein n=1 Tax=uncultured Caudovirales phage TaxID=2100421 RepID=A0A6J5SBI5_9CAUD|nr:hypothetical protein UFOVP903_43 [uncultured Caudovirales phage]CAB4197231.1 hypothetical protein UFOVP1318_3 [uncultured Caudovirales phage]CAB4210743.1 hypothetical protein UFOVP1430_41 [uncultured Caudovirales phage]